ncbi:hypothetical protein GCM10008018_45250 [Paenibacillus marchantiophytorum]|uniref:Uncharacterized protein n=1 Tax=Paenibacillus marchantiophytorum TaxID=1619310 RepID=A0ABQ1EYV1_9BACL|nr:hypothetical protein [Paenibacillus marchantiophytorum]GFZ93776.1 hypothetical protein GCM10008018_45250 [Paenibacillus marchantiophytorum]
MITEIQILKTIVNRTEYKILREWFPVKEVDITELEGGTCVIPAIVLSKISSNECTILIDWVKRWGNQLLVVPPFLSIDIKEKLQFGIDITVTKVVENLFEGLPVKEVFLTNKKPKLQLLSGQAIALDLSYHSGSGRVTLTTLPLLDYQLLPFEEKCKVIFQRLLSLNEVKGKEKEIDNELDMEITLLHQHVIILAAAGMNSIQSIEKYLKMYFKTSTNTSSTNLVREQLQLHKYLTVDGEITHLGKEYIQQCGFSAFVRELEKHVVSEGAW